MSTTKGIHTAKTPNKRCGVCKYFLPLKNIKDAGACSSEEICKRFQNVPIVITDAHEVCWCWEGEE